MHLFYPAPKLRMGKIVHPSPNITLWLAYEDLYRYLNNLNLIKWAVSELNPAVWRSCIVQKKNLKTKLIYTYPRFASRVSLVADKRSQENF
jgi:hypothetical protein